MNVYIIVTKENDYECGVREYSKLLSTKLNQSSINCQLIEIKKYDFSNLLALRSKIIKNSKVIVQYPSKSMGYSPALFFLPWLLKNRDLIIFLHEFSIFSVYRKLLLLVNCFYCTFGFTNKIEVSKFQNFFFWKKISKFILPLPSNIEYSNKQNQNYEDHRICFFGHIRDDMRNIFQFLEIVDEIKRQQPAIKIQVFGSLFVKSHTKRKKILKKFYETKIEFYEKLTSEQLSAKLHKVKVAILPLIEGVSEKKATVFACLEHEINVFTNQSEITPRWLRLLTYSIDNMKNKEVAHKVLKVFNTPNKELKIENNKKILQSFIEIHSWERLVKIYKRILN